MLIVILLLLEAIILLSLRARLCLWASSTHFSSHRWGCHWEICWILADLMQLLLIRLCLWLIIVKVIFILLLLIVISAFSIIWLWLLKASLVICKLILSCDLCKYLLLWLLSTELRWFDYFKLTSELVQLLIKCLLLPLKVLQYLIYVLMRLLSLIILKWLRIKWSWLIGTCSTVGLGWLSKIILVLEELSLDSLMETLGA